MNYSDKLKDPRWQKVRLKVLERDGWTCQECAATDKMLSVHHLYYNPQTDPWDYPLKAFRTLCADCHERETKIKRQAESSLLQQLAKIGLTAGEIEMLSDELEDANLIPLIPCDSSNDSDRTDLILALGSLFRHPKQQESLVEKYFEPLREYENRMKSGT